MSVWVSDNLSINLKEKEIHEKRKFSSVHFWLNVRRLNVLWDWDQVNVLNPRSVHCLGVNCFMYNVIGYICRLWLVAMYIITEMSLFLTVVVLVEVAVDRVVSRTVIHLSTCDLMTCSGLLTRSVECLESSLCGWRKRSNPRTRPQNIMMGLEGKEHYNPDKN